MDIRVPRPLHVFYSTSRHTNTLARFLAQGSTEPIDPSIPYFFSTLLHVSLEVWRRAQVSAFIMHPSGDTHHISHMNITRKLHNDIIPAQLHQPRAVPIVFDVMKSTLRRTSRPLSRALCGQFVVSWPWVAGLAGPERRRCDEAECENRSSVSYTLHCA
jgi:hypothetical protein